MIPPHPDWMQHGGCVDLPCSSITWEEMKRLRAAALRESWELRYMLGYPRPVVGFPLAPLAEICARRWRPTRADNAVTTSDVGKIASVLGLDLSTVHRWRRRGSLTAVVADHAANALGLHPAEVWGDAWWDVDYNEEVAV